MSADVRVPVRHPLVEAIGLERAVESADVMLEPVAALVDVVENLGHAGRQDQRVDARRGESCGVLQVAADEPERRQPPSLRVGF